MLIWLSACTCEQTSASPVYDRPAAAEHLPSKSAGGNQHKPASLAGQLRQVTPTLQCQSLFGLIFACIYLHVLSPFNDAKHSCQHVTSETLVLYRACLKMCFTAVRNMQEGHCCAPCMLRYAMTCTVPCWGHTPYGHQ